jgi:hypothetical protein
LFAAGPAGAAETNTSEPTVRTTTVGRADVTLFIVIFLLTLVFLSWKVSEGGAVEAGDRTRQLEPFSTAVASE